MAPALIMGLWGLSAVKKDETIQYLPATRAGNPAHPHPQTSLAIIFKFTLLLMRKCPKDNWHQTRVRRPGFEKLF